jgi:prepilin-type processing-associated H-X9-DG protein
MPQIQCPHCGQAYALTPEQVPQYSGQTITCMQCNRPFTVPALAQAAPAAARPPASTLPPALGGAAGTAQPRSDQPSATQPATPPPQAPLNYNAPSYIRPLQSNGLAIASLVCACLGFIIPVIPGILAIIFGIMAIRRTRDPQVGGKGLAIAGLCVGGFSLLMSGCMISILLPSLNRARETANRVKCASNMRQIGQALLLYGNENRGQYPPTLDLLLKTQDIDSTVFVCPSSNDTAAPGATAAQQAGSLNSGGHLSYIYLGRGMTYNSPADAPVLYEPLTNHSNDGTNVLFGDGHVSWLTRQQAAATLKGKISAPQ